MHIYTYILCFTTQSKHLFYRTDGPVLPHWGNQQSGWWLNYHHLIHAYVHTYILFVLQIAQHHTYIYIYTLFHHTELTCVLSHGLPSFTTLGKPTIWMVTYLSPSYTPICTRIHTYIPVVLQIAHHHIHIYIHICSVSPHRVKYLFYRTDSPPSCIHIYTYMLCFTTQLTSVLPHRWPSFTTLGKPAIWMVTYYHHLIHPHVHTYTQIYCLFYR